MMLKLATLPHPTGLSTSLTPWDLLRVPVELNPFKHQLTSSKLKPGHINLIPVRNKQERGQGSTWCQRRWPASHWREGSWSPYGWCHCASSGRARCHTWTCRSTKDERAHRPLAHHIDFKIQKLKQAPNLQHLKLLIPTVLIKPVNNLSETTLEATINQIEQADPP